MSGAGVPSPATHDTEAMRMLESALVLVEAPAQALGLTPEALADMVRDLMERLVYSKVYISIEGRCDERLLNEGRGTGAVGKKCLGVTRTGHHAHMVWEASEDEHTLALRARVRFVRVRRLIVEEEG